MKDTIHSLVKWGTYAIAVVWLAHAARDVTYGSRVQDGGSPMLSLFYLGINPAGGLYPDGGYRETAGKLGAMVLILYGVAESLLSISLLAFLRMVKYVVYGVYVLLNVAVIFMGSSGIWDVLVSLFTLVATVAWQLFFIAVVFHLKTILERKDTPMGSTMDHPPSRNV